MITNTVVEIINLSIHLRYWDVSYNYYYAYYKEKLVVLVPLDLLVPER